MTSTERPLSDALYELLVEDEDARVCRDIPDAACDEQPRSFMLQLASQTLTKIGDALVSSRLMLAWMLTSIGSPPIFISLLVPLRESLSLLPQLLVAQRIREHAVRKWFWVYGGLGQALALLGMAAALLTLPGPTASLVIIALLVFFSLARGVCSVAAKDVLGKTVSKARRGRLTGMATSAAGLVTLGVAVIIWWAPEQSRGDVAVFVVILAAAAIIWVLAAMAYGAIPEVPGAVEGGGNAFEEAWRSLGLLVSNSQFRDFVIARILLVATAFAIPYMVVLIQRSGGAALTALAAILAAEGTAGLVSGDVWGRWSDRSAHQVMAAAAALSSAVMAITVGCYWWAPSILGHPLAGAGVIFVAAVAHHGVRVGRKTYLLDMATADNRAQLTAVSNTVLGVFMLCGVGLGLIDTVFGTVAVLLLLLLLACLAIWRSLSLPPVD